MPDVKQSPFARLAEQEMLANLAKANGTPVEQLDADRVERDDHASAVTDGDLSVDEEEASKPKFFLGSIAKGWITIGGGPCEGAGEHCGGTKVFVDGDGKITAGPSALTGKPINNLPGKAKPKDNLPKQEAPPQRAPIQSETRMTDADLKPMVQTTAGGTEGGPPTGEPPGQGGSAVDSAFDAARQFYEHIGLYKSDSLKDNIKALAGIDPNILDDLTSEQTAKFPGGTYNEALRSLEQRYGQAEQYVDGKDPDVERIVNEKMDIAKKRIEQAVEGLEANGMDKEAAFYRDHALPLVEEARKDLLGRAGVGEPAQKPGKPKPSPEKKPDSPAGQQAQQDQADRKLAAQQQTAIAAEEGNQVKPKPTKEDAADKATERVMALQGRDVNTSRAASKSSASSVVEALEGEKFSGSISHNDVATVLDELKIVGEGRLAESGMSTVDVKNPEALRAVLAAAKTGKFDGQPVTNYLQLEHIARQALSAGAKPKKPPQSDATSSTQSTGDKGKPKPTNTKPPGPVNTLPKGTPADSNTTSRRTSRMEKPPSSIKSSAEVWANSLKPEEKSAVEAYADPDRYVNGKQIAYALNDELRSGKLSPGMRKIADGLSAAIDRAGKLPGPQTTYRGIAAKTPKDAAAHIASAEAALKSGEPIGFDGFTSSSLDPSYVVENFAAADHSVVYEIAARTGAYVSQFSTAGDHEKEILQKPGTKYKVVGIDKGAAVGAVPTWGPDEGKQAKRTVIRLEEV